MCIYCGTNNYRKIYKNHHGPIPKDETGRTFDIHHIDRDKSNNKPNNLVALSIDDHYATHLAVGDIKACHALSLRMNKSNEEIKEIAKRRFEIYGNPFGDARPYDARVSCLVCRVEVGFPNFVRSHGDKCGTLSGTCSGSDNSRYDQTPRTFYNHDTGEVFIGTRYDLYSCKGLNKSGIGDIINNPTKVSQGWSLTPRVLYEFSHDDHGEVIMTKRQFADAYSLRYNLVGKLIDGKSSHYKGWRVRRTRVPERTDTSLHSSAP